MVTTLYFHSTTVGNIYLTALVLVYSGIGGIFFTRVKELYPS